MLNGRYEGFVGCYDTLDTGRRPVPRIHPNIVEWQSPGSLSSFKYSEGSDLSCVLRSDMVSEKGSSATEVHVRGIKAVMHCAG